MMKMNLAGAFVFVNVLSATAFAQDTSSAADGGADAAVSNAGVSTAEVSTEATSGAASSGSGESVDAAVPVLVDAGEEELDAAVPALGDAGGGEYDAGDLDAAVDSGASSSPDSNSDTTSEPKPPKVRHYERLKNESRACSVAAVGQRSDYWATLALASVGWTLVRRRGRSAS